MSSDRPCGSTGSCYPAVCARSCVAVVTTNAQDFIALLNVPVHPGLIVSPESGLSRQEQWEQLRRVVEHVKKSGDEDFLPNKLIEITGVGHFKIRETPEP